MSDMIHFLGNTMCIYCFKLFNSWKMCFSYCY